MELCSDRGFRLERTESSGEGVKPTGPDRTGRRFHLLGGEGLAKRMTRPAEHDDGGQMGQPVGCIAYPGRG